MSPPRAILAGDPRFSSPGAWWIFERPQEELVAWDAAEVSAVLDRVDRATRLEGRWAVGFVAYEAAPAFEPRAVVLPQASGVPMAWFGLFSAPQSAPPPVVPLDFVPPPLEADVSPAEYTAAINAIHEAIVRGDTYQVNFTYRLRGSFTESAEALFARLVHAQNSPYAAFLEHDAWAVASVSPELFFERRGQHVLCRPMKGTIRRGRTLAEDGLLAHELASSQKERAENVMIVDMVRNDLGRLARPGSVQIPRLFAIERYPTVTQMTSEVEAEIDAPLPVLFQALFPCASITGAPRLRTMEILAGLEASARGIYTGALGFVAPGGDARFSVAIRTSWIDRQAGTVEYGTGSGITWDSRAEGELNEARIKARVFVAPEPVDFELLETILWRPRHGFVLLERHLARMADSAEYFLRPFDREAALRALDSTIDPQDSAALKVRLLLARDGSLRTTRALLGPIRRRWRVGLAPIPIDPSDPFLFHKTTRREVYDAASRAVPDVDEVLLWNPTGELTEGTRTNLALRLEGRLWTPPVECGLLAGCRRGELLASGRLAERVLTKEDLARAEKIYLMSSVRGWIRAAMTE